MQTDMLRSSTWSVWVRTYGNGWRKVQTSYQLRETAHGGVQRHNHQKHGEGRGESLGAHPGCEPTAEEAAKNRGEGECTDQQPVQVDAVAHPRQQCRGAVDRDH